MKNLTTISNQILDSATIDIMMDLLTFSTDDDNQIVPEVVFELLKYRIDDSLVAEYRGRNIRWFKDRIKRIDIVDNVAKYILGACYIVHGIIERIPSFSVEGPPPVYD